MWWGWPRRRGESPAAASERFGFIVFFDFPPPPSLRGENKSGVSRKADTDKSIFSRKKSGKQVALRSIKSKHPNAEIICGGFHSRRGFCWETRAMLPKKVWGKYSGTLRPSNLVSGSQ